MHDLHPLDSLRVLIDLLGIGCAFKLILEIVKVKFPETDQGLDEIEDY